ncbi:GNAT family N-acetyltransferase [Streptomyces camelliae]|uniref:GNAT family N-acetyltransferase n=1 Tax=Streptomyces camelliae TaxID=3004093 RepID=A0ABY7PEB0_9ACTN|nr:GNAT family N-acetyltransferase [Streptomyces sp. HUAS 2-6]WBO68963.1 GNAT family N-acetyltransferase [Streptomyces sp. HUAS 2-6]
MTSPDPSITAVAADDPRILRLVRDLDADLAARYPDEPCTGGAHIHPEIRFLLAEVDGRPVGCCAVQPFPSPDTAAELKRMYVVPQARGQGIAARLLAEAEHTAATLGHPEVRLETAVHQPEAIALYTRAGYTPIPNYPPYQDKTLSRCYAKPLSLPEARPQDRQELAAFLAGQGLSPQDVLAPGTRYWLTRDAAGPAVTVGLERQGHCVLLRSVAVRPDLRGLGAARRLVERVLTEAAAWGGRSVYVFSTGAGPWWERLGFHSVPVAEAAEALSDAPQVRQYRQAGTLAEEAAWRRDLLDSGGIGASKLSPTDADPPAAGASHLAGATDR